MEEIRQGLTAKEMDGLTATIAEQKKSISELTALVMSLLGRIERIEDRERRMLGVVKTILDLVTLAAPGVRMVEGGKS